jgi:hypothetical protein
MVVDGLFTERECLAIIERADQSGFHFADTRHGRDEEIRRGRKCILTDREMASIAFSRLEAAVPHWPMASCCDEWAAPSAVWENLRVLSYDGGDYFQRHMDAPCLVGDSAAHPKCRSFVSLVIYLADSSDGSGATRFYLPTASGGAEDGMGESAAVNETALDVVPRAGRAVLFAHETAHESLALPPSAPRKYIVRGDVLCAPCVPQLQTLSLARQARMVSRLSPSADELVALRLRNDVLPLMSPRSPRRGTGRAATPRQAPTARNGAKSPAGSALQKVKFSRASAVAAGGRAGGLAVVVEA